MTERSIILLYVFYLLGSLNGFLIGTIFGVFLAGG